MIFVITVNGNTFSSAVSDTRITDGWVLFYLCGSDYTLLSSSKNFHSASCLSWRNRRRKLLSPAISVKFSRKGYFRFLKSRFLYNPNANMNGLFTVCANNSRLLLSPLQLADAIIRTLTGGNVTFEDAVE